MASALQLPVEFVEHEVAEQWQNHSLYTKGNLGLAKLLHCLVVGSMEWGYYGES